MAATNGSNQTFFASQNVGVSGTSTLVLSHNLGECPWVSWVLAASVASPGQIGVFGINASQVSLSLGPATTATTPHVIHVRCDRIHTLTQGWAPFIAPVLAGLGALGLVA